MATERWINVVMTVTIPLDVPIDVPERVLQEVALDACEAIDLPRNAVVAIRHELVEDGEPVPVDG